MNYEDAINTQYGQQNLGKKILAMLEAGGLDTARLSREVFAPIEELHLRGRTATMELANGIDLNESMRVLDIGCGIGGPARTLAYEFGCHVMGLDLSEEYCIAAEMINERVGLSKNIEIRKGNALDMPFDDSKFDVVFMQHVLMNIENKEQVFSQINRVLHSNGLLALYTICAGSITPIHFPVFWANNPDISFLITPSELRQLINNKGFKELSWKDDTKKILEGIQRAKSRPRASKPQPIDFGLILANPSTKWRNGVRNLNEGRMMVIQGIFETNQ